MAAAPLGLHPALKAWYSAGLRHVYFDDAALAVFSCADAPVDARHDEGAHAGSRTFRQGHAGQGDAVQGHSRQGSPSHPVPGQSSRMAQGDQQVAAGQDRESASAAPARPARPPRPERPQPAEAKASNARSYGAQEATETRSGGTAHEPPTDTGPMPSPLEPEAWPAQWRSLFERTPSGAPLLWTYWALGDDLGGAPDIQRRELLRQILGDLAMPRGTHCFWPVSLPDDSGELTSDIPIFLAGVERLAPRACIIMGSRALQAAAPGLRLRPFQQARHRGRLIIVLPDMDMLLKEPQRAKAVVAYLRPALAAFARRHPG